MALTSPGVQVSVINESQYAPTSAATVPLLIVATAENKTTPQGTLAEGTLKENAGDLYVLTSQRDVLNFFGTPRFYTDTNNTPIHGYELNEYGLQTAYSLLGVTNRAYILRADIDLSELVGLSGRPLAEPEDMTYWLDLGPTRWGMFVWDAEAQEFTAQQPFVITNSADLDGGVPRSSIGNVGSVAIVATNSNLPAYGKNRNNQWVLVGSREWMESIPAVFSAFVLPPITASESININGETVTASGSEVTDLAADINAADIDGISAAVVDGRLEIYITDEAASDGTNPDGAMIIENNSGDILGALGIKPDTYFRPAVQLSGHTSVPQWKNTDNTPRPSNSIWIKTTGANFGASFSVKRYNSLTQNWQLLSAPLYANDQTANRFLDSLRGGVGIPVGSVYIQYDVLQNDTVTYKVFDRARDGVTSVTGTLSNPSFDSGDQFLIKFSFPNFSELAGPFTVELAGTTPEAFVEAVLALNLNFISAQVNADRTVSIVHTAGGVIELLDGTGSPLNTAGITVANDFCRAGPDGEIIVSNWVVTDIEVANEAPGRKPESGTKWYWGEIGEADIMVHDGNTWKGYRNVGVDARGFNLTSTDSEGPIFSSRRPTVQNDGSPLAYGDLWIDTSDLENYPKLYRWETSQGRDFWKEIDLSDQTTENGILFADARFATSGDIDPSEDAIEPISDIIVSDYVDLDAPNPQLYPRGMLLWNTRRSSFNVKEYRRDYFNNEDFFGQVLPVARDAWVSVSGRRENGHAFFGRKAQRNVVAAAMRAAVDGNTEVREEQREFNLISAPGYPELQPNMAQLNNDRKQTAFIVGDSPFRLRSEGTDLANWLLNNDLADVDGENALVTRDAYTGVWYPSLLGDDLQGKQVVMPPSYGVLRMIIRSDQKSYPWFAPAGVRRGTIDNASRLGYLTETGEFVSIGVREGIRDLLYENNVNPLMRTAETGIIAYGQKTRASEFSALDRINVARLIAFMRLQLDKIARPFVFEQNDKITRDEFKGVLESFCNDLVTKRALKDYLVIVDDSNNTRERIDRNEMYGDILIEPLKAVEFIYIPIRIRNTGGIN